MRSLQLFTLALLATAARADQIGIFTFSAIPSIATLTVNGQNETVDVVMDFPSSSAFVSVSVPYGWMVGAIGFKVSESADVPAGAFTGVSGGIRSYDVNGDQIISSLDLGNSGSYLGPCTDCGFSSVYDAPETFVGIPLTTITIEENVIPNSSVDIKELQIAGEFTADRLSVRTAPEPSTLLLLVTVGLALLLVRTPILRQRYRRARGTQI